MDILLLLCMWYLLRLWFNPCSCTFFYIVIVTRANIGMCWNVLESIWIPLKYGNSNGFQHIPTDSNGNHSWRLLDSNWFHWIPSDSVGNSMEWKTKMAEAPAKWILLEFHGIPTFRLESGGFRWNSWGRVKTSSLDTIPYGIHGIHPFHMVSIWKLPGSVKYTHWVMVLVGSAD